MSSEAVVLRNGILQRVVNYVVMAYDWKQAFDSIDHNSMLIALQRFGLSDRSLRIIRSIYSDPTFITTGIDGSQATGKVGSGIRQGCPLSPYLFVIVLTVIFEDLDWALLKNNVATNTSSSLYLTPCYGVGGDDL